MRYAIQAGAYLISGLSKDDLKFVRSVIFFGSAARLTASENSDIDIFFDLKCSRKSQLKIRAKLNKLAEQFYITNNALQFKSHGIDNEISIKAGRLEEWEELSQSIASTGIVLYGKYTAEPKGLSPYTLLSWENPGKAKGALLNKFYGYKSGKKIYAGLLEKSGGIKFCKGSAIVPAQNSSLFIDVLEKYKINYSRRDVWG